MGETEGDWEKVCLFLEYPLHRIQRGGGGKYRRTPLCTPMADRARNTRHPIEWAHKKNSSPANQAIHRRREKELTDCVACCPHQLIREPHPNYLDK